jgi:hypothetical protein
MAMVDVPTSGKYLLDREYSSLIWKASSRVWQRTSRDFTVDGLDLLERGKDKHCCFIETRFGLTEDVGRGDGVGKTKSLDLSKMLETFSN